MASRTRALYSFCRFSDAWWNIASATNLCSLGIRVLLSFQLQSELGTGLLEQLHGLSSCGFPLLELELVVLHLGAEAFDASGGGVLVEVGSVHEDSDQLQVVIQVLQTPL